MLWGIKNRQIFLQICGRLTEIPSLEIVWKSTHSQICKHVCKFTKLVIEFDFFHLKSAFYFIPFDKQDTIQKCCKSYSKLFPKAQVRFLLFFIWLQK